MGTVIMQLPLLQQGEPLLQIWVTMLGKRVTQVSLIILSHLQLSHTIKHVNNRSGPSRKSSMGPVASDHCSPSAEPHPGAPLERLQFKH